MLKKAILLVLSLLMAAVSISNAAVSGRLVIKGSDTILPLAQQWAEEFQKRNPQAIISVTGGGSALA